jgi:deferrochelatase/peroxidase EfeB
VWLGGPDRGVLWHIKFELENKLSGNMIMQRRNYCIPETHSDSNEESPHPSKSVYPRSRRLLSPAAPPQPVSVALQVGTVPAGEPGAGGTHVMAQEWVHDLKAFDALLFPTRSSPPPTSDGIASRSSPYTNPFVSGGDGTSGVYMTTFCASQAPLRERLEAVYGLHGGPRDRLTDFSSPASGAFYFAPSVEMLDTMLAAAQLSPQT